MSLLGLSHEQKVSYILQGVQEVLVSKNVLEPSSIFSDADPIDQLKVRIDDKLTRIKVQGLNNSENALVFLTELIGYLVLLKMHLAEKVETEQIAKGLGDLADAVREVQEKEKQASFHREKRLNEHLKVQPFGDVPKEFTEIESKEPVNELGIHFSGDPDSPTSDYD